MFVRRRQCEALRHRAGCVAFVLIVVYEMLFDDAAVVSDLTSDSAVWPLTSTPIARQQTCGGWMIMTVVMTTIFKRLTLR